MSDASICSNALVRLGEPTITSLDDENDAARICKAVYPELREQLLTMHAWSFATARSTQLSREINTPNSRWPYSFLFPTDLLGPGPHHCYSTADQWARPLAAGVEYLVEGDRRLLAMYTEMYCVYPVDRGDANWPPAFRQFVVAALCAEIAFPITNQTGIQQLWMLNAYGSPADEGRGGLFKIAADGNSWTVGQDQIDTDDLLAYRFA